jgi:pyroglutamyl-peptidase
MKIKKIILILSIIFIFLNSTFTSSLVLNITEENQSIVLLIGFGPFLEHNVNPSELIAAELDGEIINDSLIIGLQVQPNLNNFTESIETVYNAIESYAPDYVFSIGLAARFKRIRIEKIGYNLKIENRNNSKLEKLIPDGPWLKISPLPAMKIVKELRQEGIPSKIALYPGLSLCNGMLYSVLHYVDIYDLDIKSGFIHVPLHKSEENPNGMELKTMVNATKIIIQTCLDYNT